jgi:hypothetical protein
MDVDRQRIAAVRALEVLGFTYRIGDWLAAARVPRRYPLGLGGREVAMWGARLGFFDLNSGCCADAPFSPTVTNTSLSDSETTWRG